MSSDTKSVLYIRLPCWKIYPGGVIYVADYIHKQRPDIRQHLLDLALVAPADRKRVLKEHLDALRPDIVAFSWRNMQSFGPHPEDDALDVVMNFDHSPSLWRKLKAARSAFSHHLRLRRQPAAQLRLHEAGPEDCCPRRASWSAARRCRSSANTSPRNVRPTR